MELANRERLILFCLLMLVMHVAHVFEEVFARFWIVDAVFGLGWFLAGNWLLFCIPVAVFYFVILGRRWAYRLNVIYAVVMMLNGVGHNVATIVTGKYFGGFGGGYTGIGLVVVGALMLRHLRKGMIEQASNKEIQ